MAADSSWRTKVGGGAQGAHQRQSPSCSQRPFPKNAERTPQWELSCLFSSTYLATPSYPLAAPSPPRGVTIRAAPQGWALHDPLHGAARHGTKRKTLYGKTRGEVSEKLTKAMADRDGGLVFEGEDQLLGEYLDRWLNGTVKGLVKPSTFEGFERMVRNHIKPELGHRKLKILIPDHVQYFYQRKLDAGLAPGTVRLMHGILHKALEQAVKWGTIPRNVCKAVTPPKPNPEEIRPLDAEDAERFLHAANGDRLEALYVLAVTAGLRVGELLALSSGKT
jgi:hypothetical protein